MGCSIISTQTPLGFRVRDSAELWRDKSLLLTFERTATYSNNQLNWGGRALAIILSFCHREVLLQHTAGGDKTGRDGGLSAPRFLTWAYDLLILKLW